MPPAKIKSQKNSSPSTILAIDVGNTYIHFSVMQDLKTLTKFGVDSALRGKVLAQKLTKVLTALPKSVQISQIIICSVVPEVTKVLEPTLKKVLKAKVRVVGRELQVPIKNLYTNPSQVGQDRLVCAFAACELYGHPAIVIDLGTAITLDAVSTKREYLGGIIVPGIRITAETLFERTALLPLVDIHQPKNLIGKDTQGSILSGIFYGYGEMLKGLIGLLTKQLKTTPRVILTGGHAELMANYIKAKTHIVDQNLVMKGLALLA